MLRNVKQGRHGTGSTNRAGIVQAREAGQAWRRLVKQGKLHVEVQLDVQGRHGAGSTSGIGFLVLDRSSWISYLFIDRDCFSWRGAVTFEAGMCGRVKTGPLVRHQ